MVVHAVKDAADFQQHVHKAQAFGEKAAVIVDFSAEWCGPCKMIGPVFEDLSNKAPKVTFLKVDVDALQDVAASCGVRAMPTFIAYHGGAVQDTLTGADKGKLQAMVDKLVQLASTSTAGPGHKLGGAEGPSPSSSAAPAAPDSADARRAAMAAAAEARMKAMQAQAS